MSTNYFRCFKEIARNTGSNQESYDKDWFVFLVPGYNPPEVKGGTFHLNILNPLNDIKCVQRSTNNIRFIIAIGNKWLHYLKNALWSTYDWKSDENSSIKQLKFKEQDRPKRSAERDHNEDSNQVYTQFTL